MMMMTLFLNIHETIFWTNSYLRFIYFLLLPRKHLKLEGCTKTSYWLYISYDLGQTGRDQLVGSLKQMSTASLKLLLGLSSCDLCTDLLWNIKNYLMSSQTNNSI